MSFENAYPSDPASGPAPKFTSVRFLGSYTISRDESGRWWLKTKHPVYRGGKIVGWKRSRRRTDPPYPDWVIEACDSAGRSP